MTWLLGLFARLGLPESVRKPFGYLTAFLALTALLWLLWVIWLHRHDAEVIAKHEEKIDAQVQAQSTAAATAASAAVERSRSEVERVNDEARRAAADSDDPLKAGLDKLRGM